MADNNSHDRLGVRRDGQKVLLAVKNIGGETEAAWCHVREDLLARGLKAPELLIVDGGKGLEAAHGRPWPAVGQISWCSYALCTRSATCWPMLAKHLHDEIKAE